jgi:hypothetical protein
MYKLDDDYLGVYSNNNDVTSITGDEDFGLDVYEPQFFAGALDWNAAGDYSVALKFDVNDFDDDIFYFCHVSILKHNIQCFFIVSSASILGSAYHE